MNLWLGGNWCGKSWSICRETHKISQSSLLSDNKSNNPTLSCIFSRLRKISREEFSRAHLPICSRLSRRFSTDSRNLQFKAAKTSHAFFTVHSGEIFTDHDISDIFFSSPRCTCALRMYASVNECDWLITNHSLISPRPRAGKGGKVNFPLEIAGYWESFMSKIRWWVFNLMEVWYEKQGFYRGKNFIYYESLKLTNFAHARAVGRFSHIGGNRQLRVIVRVVLFCWWNFLPFLHLCGWELLSRKNLSFNSNWFQSFESVSRRRRFQV